MGVTVRKKGNDWYVYIRQHGECAARKCRNEKHAIKTQEAVATAIAAGSVQYRDTQKKRPEAIEEKPKVQTFAEFSDKTMSLLGGLTRGRHVLTL
jgi:23S rRNA G2445 N2-methylase RlmL